MKIIFICIFALVSMSSFSQSRNDFPPIEPLIEDLAYFDFEKETSFCALYYQNPVDFNFWRSFNIFKYSYIKNNDPEYRPSWDPDAPAIVHLKWKDVFGAISDVLPYPSEFYQLLGDITDIRVYDQEEQEEASLTRALFVAIPDPMSEFCQDLPFECEILHLQVYFRDGYNVSCVLDGRD